MSSSSRTIRMRTRVTFPCGSLFHIMDEVPTSARMSILVVSQLRNDPDCQSDLRANKSGKLRSVCALDNRLTGNIPQASLKLVVLIRCATGRSLRLGSRGSRRHHNVTCLSVSNYGASPKLRSY